MRALIYLLTFSAVIASGFWAYRENYATQQALKDVSRLNAEIADLREALSIQRAEWAYLNRPERLRELVNLNFDRLKLVPFGADQFVDVGQVAFPPPEAPAPPPGAEGPAIERPAWYPPRRPQESTP